MSKVRVQVGLKQLVGISTSDGSGLELCEIPFSKADFDAEVESGTFVSVAVICGACSERNSRLIKNIIDQVNYRTQRQEYIFDEHQYLRPRNGIWMCSEPLQYFSATGDKKVLVLMELKGRIDGFSTHSNLKDVMELGLLLSSVFIFNFGSDIDEDVLQKLTHLASFAKQAVNFNGTEYYRHSILRNSKSSTGLSKRATFQRICVLKNMGDDRTPIPPSHIDLEDLECLLKTMDHDQTPKRPYHTPLGFSGSNKFYLSDILECSSRQTVDAKTARELILVHSETIFYSIGLDKDITVPISSLDCSKELCGVPISIKYFLEFIESTRSIVNICKTGSVERLPELKEKVLYLAAYNFYDYLWYILNSTHLSWKLTDNYDKKLKELNSRLKDTANGFFEQLLDHANKWWCREDPLGKICATGENSEYPQEIQLAHRHLKSKVSKFKIWYNEYLDTFLKMSEALCEGKHAAQREELKSCATNCVNSAITQYISSWNKNLFIPDVNFYEKINEITKAAMENMKLAYPEIEDDFTQTMRELVGMSNRIAEKNEQVYSMISEALRKALVAVMEKMAIKVVFEINALRYKSLIEFNRFCVEQRDMHEDYFLRHYRKKFCTHVFSMEWPKCQAIFDQLLTILKNKYIDRSVADAVIKREDVLEEVDMNPAVSHENTTRVRVDFGTEDIKNIVFPKLQIHIVNILADKQTTTMVILQLCELGIFDTIEMELSLHGKFQLERERALTLSRVIQNRNSDEIKLCLQCLSNLRDLEATSFRFRQAFTSVFPSCLKS